MRRMQQHNPVVDMVQYQLDVSIHLADAVFSTTEKIDRAMLDVTHQAVDGQLKFARAVADMRDPAKLTDLQVSIAARPEKAMHCQQQIMAALVEMQAEFGKSVRIYMERLGQNAAEQAGEAGEQVTNTLNEAAGSNSANPFSGMLSVWEQAFREASRMASQNMMVARSSVENAANAARDAMSRSMEEGSASVNGHAHASGKGRGARHHK